MEQRIRVNIEESACKWKNKNNNEQITLSHMKLELIL